MESDWADRSNSVYRVSTYVRRAFVPKGRFRVTPGGLHDNLTHCLIAFGVGLVLLPVGWIGAIPFWAAIIAIVFNWGHEYRIVVEPDDSPLRWVRYDPPRH
ncbi:MAG: hypothetical protein HY782_19810 [Chloroflexi bacterium]|nr:hypothetical protein [Chloroflexota bacterium]